MPNPSQFDLRFGAIAPRLASQFAAQDLKMNVGELEHFQRDADAITRIHVRQLIPDSVAHAARKKLMKAITKELSRQEVERDA